MNQNTKQIKHADTGCDQVKKKFSLPIFAAI